MFSSNASQVSNDVKYIEDVCSVYLRTGTGSSQTVTTGIKENTGALVISKSRSAATDWAWYDTFRGATYDLVSNSTAAQTTQSQGLTAFNADGHTWGTLAKVNTNGATYVDTVLKPTPKFFDVVTYTGNGTAGRTVAHSLGSVPGCMIVRPTSAVDDWFVYHRSLLNSQSLFLNLTSAASNTPSAWNSTTPTSTEFTVGTNTATNANGVSYIAYLFAHDAGGFGLTGTDNVISCGSMNGATGTTVTLGYEPQFIMYKASTTTGNWVVIDNMRGMTTDGGDNTLTANTTNAEGGPTTILAPNPTGFSVKSNLTSGQTYIYIAIRRGPMKVPTSGTSVFSGVARSGTGATATITAGFPVDLEISKTRNVGNPSAWFDRLRGATNWLRSSGTNAEATTADSLTSFGSNTGVTVGADVSDGIINYSTSTYANWMFSRAPSFFDEVCYSGTSAKTAFNHNLTVVPELIIVKRRSGVATWPVGVLFTASTCKELKLDTTDAATNSTYTDYFGAQPTSTTFTMESSTGGNLSGSTYVAYLFATCAGVSKVGSYTGTGTTKQVDCGFTGGARFVLIKRTDSTGDWYVWDSARGIVAGNDPYLLLNSTAAEVTNTDYVDTYSAGFEISSTAPAAINANGGTFIFLAIA